VNQPAPLLLDTCAAIWLAGGEPVARETSDAIEGARDARQPIYVSPITAWEIGLLVARGRMSMQMTPERWFTRLLEAPGLRLADMPVHVLIASSFLPGELPGDPADRILAATAREFGFCLVTRDRPLLEYAEQGHVRALPC
jgi:PIN domain nuclease of toxin-antitoxin system